MTATISICVLLAVHLMQGSGHLIDRLNEKPSWMRWSIYYSMVLAILLVGNFGSKEFIYFQF